jgi:phage FluMu protein Com
VTIGSTALVMTSILPFADVRCRTCKRLLFRWEFTGRANIEVKCPRCGQIDMIVLSTG